MLQIPDSVLTAITHMWRISKTNEEGVFNSPLFENLQTNCQAEYSSIRGSRLCKQPDTAATSNELKSALQNFFRWHGAPWYKECNLSADETALRLHRAFLSKEVNRTHFAPLDRFSLENGTSPSHQIVENIRFGPNEISLLTNTELAERVPRNALNRFGRLRQFPIENLDGFYWLVASEREKAGPIWERVGGLSRLFKMTSNEIFSVPIYESRYPKVIEDALFVLLLSFVKEPNEALWKPFAVPWTYSFTDDPFADAPRAPDPSLLTRKLIGHPGEEFEVPDQSNWFNITNQLLEMLEKRWCKLQAVRVGTAPDQANLHPLTIHFFVKALGESGIDEIIANISSMEATLMLPREKRKKLMNRYSCLVRDENAYQWLDRAYKLRNKYLHSLGDPEETIPWEDLAQMRWSLVKAVDAYLDLTCQQSELNRKELLKFIENL